MWGPLGTGDGTLAGQLTVACYVLAAGACALNARPGRTQRGLWATLAAALAVGGLAEHLDLQGPVMACGRGLAGTLGWPEGRALPRMLITAGLLALVGAALAPVALRWRALDIGALLALAGTGAAVGFVVVRAAYANDVDRILGLQVMSPCTYRAPELLALALATVGARISARRAGV